MLEPDQTTMDQMARVADDRARAWRLFGKIVAGPDADLVERLRDGRLLQEVRDVSRWLGEESPLAMQEPSLRAVIGRARRHTLDDNLGAVQQEWARLFADGDGSLSVEYDAAATACEHEAAAWRSGDHPRAKELRMEQFTRLQAELEPMPDWCVRLKGDGRLYVSNVLARLVAAHLSAESGRDVLTVLARS